MAVWSRKEERPKWGEEAPVGTAVVKGVAAGPGVASGPVKTCLAVDGAKKLKKGDISVAKTADPDWVPYMRMAAIVTDEGGRTPHAAIVSRLPVIPAVLGAGGATSVLRGGELYTVDGSKEVVTAGAAVKAEVPAAPAAPKEIILHIYGAVPTGTKLYVNLGVSEKIDEYKDSPFGGIGLMRIEFVIGSWIGQRPHYLVSIGQEHKFVTRWPRASPRWPPPSIQDP